MRACIRCGNTSGYTLIGGPCITCEYDDSDCDELVTKGKAEVVDEICALLRKSGEDFIASGRKEHGEGYLAAADEIEKTWKNEHA